ncbi:hypothetical protein CHISP_0529 [Chitinispirillum alkaliphilum]|nr:hypothetical protein CHISP_0529 [Chitinispirillum alkaliphilum]
MKIKKSKIVAALLSIIVLCGGVYSDGLPGEYLLTERWRTFFSNISPIHNPANLAEHSHPSLRGVITLSSYDAASLFETGFTMPLGFFHTAGLTIAGEAGKPIENWIPHNGQLISSDTSRSHSNLLFTASYSVNPWRRLITGLNVNYHYHTNFGFDPDYGLGFDAGLAYRLVVHPFWGYHRIGLAYRNIPFFQMGSMNRVEYSPLLRANYDVSLLNGALNFNLAYSLKDFTASADLFSRGENVNEWEMMAGWGIRPLRYLGLKGYFEFHDDINSTSSFSLRSWGVAGSFDIPHLNRGRDFSVIYQFNDEMSNTVHNSHSAYFKYDFGLHREEMYARRMSRLANISPSELYNRAMRLYHRQRYWDAYFIFAQILTEHPDFQVNDLVTYHAGSSLEKMQMYDEAVTMYSEAKSSYPLSNIIPFVDLGLMRIHYRRNNLSGVRNQYVELNRPKVPDSIRSHGAYLMGQTAIANSDYRTAVREFALVKEEHPDYIFANHSQAIAHLLANSGEEHIMASLRRSIDNRPTTDAQREMINRSLLFAGYLFYESNQLSKAVAALRDIPSRSKYYSEALLGLGWTAIRAGQFHDCISVGRSLRSSTDDVILLAEAALIESYAHIAQKRYDRAAGILQNAFDNLNDYRLISEDSVATLKREYQSKRGSHSELVAQIAELASRGALVDMNIADLYRREHLSILEEFDEYYRFIDNHNRASFFARNINQVMYDVEYVLARAKRMSGVVPVSRELQRTIDQEREIQQELERLRREMDNIEE